MTSNISNNQQFIPNPEAEQRKCSICDGSRQIKQRTSANAPYAVIKCPFCAGDGKCRTPSNCGTHGCHGGCLPIEERQTTQVREQRGMNGLEIISDGTARGTIVRLKNGDSLNGVMAVEIEPILPGGHVRAKITIDRVALQMKPKDATTNRTDILMADSQGLTTQLQPHQQRVIDEKIELDTKATALSKFIGESPIFQTVDAAEQERLKEQCEVMWQYSEILGARIAAFSTGANNE